MQEERLSRIYFCVLFILICHISSLQSAEKSEAEYLRDAHVCLEVQSYGRDLILIGKEYNVETFRLQVGDSAFSNPYYSYTQGNFNIRRLGSGMAWEHRNYNISESFGISIQRSGNAELLDTPGTDTGFSRSRIYGVKTFGTLENRGNQAFHSLVTSANQFFNYGTIQSYTVQLFQNYLYNQGHMEFGRTPVAIVDLRTPLTRTPPSPSYKHHIVENHGRFISNGRFNIKDALSYHEYGTSDFDDLDIHWGNVTIKSGGTNNINGTLMGGITDFTVESGGALEARWVNLYPVRNLRVDSGGHVHTKGRLKLTVNGSYSHSGVIASDDAIEMALMQIIRSQTGTLYAPNGVTHDASTAMLEQQRQQEVAEQQRVQIERDSACTQRQEAEMEASRLREEIASLERDKQERLKAYIDSLPSASDYDDVVFRGGGRRWGQSRNSGFSFSVGFGSGGVRFSGSTRGTTPPAAMSREELDTHFAPLLSQKQRALDQAMSRASSYQSIESRPIYRTTPVTIASARPGVVYTRSQEYQTPVVQAKQRVQTTLAKLTVDRGRVDREHQFWDGLRTSMTRAGIPSTDIQTIFTSTDITAVLHNLRNYDQSFTSATSIYTGSLRSLARDSEVDRSWFQRHFNPTRAEVFEMLDRSSQLNPVERLVFSHPEILLGPAGLALQGVRTAGALALQRVSPRLLAVGSVNHAWESLTSYMKDEKDEDFCWSDLDELLPPEFRTDEWWKKRGL